MEDHDEFKKVSSNISTHRYVPAQIRENLAYGSTLMTADEDSGPL